MSHLQFRIGRATLEPPERRGAAETVTELGAGDGGSMSGEARSYNPAARLLPAERHNAGAPQENMVASIADLRLFRCAGCYNETKVVGSLKCEDSDASSEDSEPEEDSDSEEEQSISGQAITELKMFPEAEEEMSPTSTPPRLTPSTSETLRTLR